MQKRVKTRQVEDDQKSQSQSRLEQIFAQMLTVIHTDHLMYFFREERDSQLQAGAPEDQQPREHFDPVDRSPLAEPQDRQRRTITLDDMRELIAQINHTVPRSRYHLCWRLALHLRCAGPLVNQSEHAQFTWAQLAATFRTEHAGTFRYSVLKRKQQHQGHDAVDFNVLTCGPAGHDAAAQSVPDELCAVAVRRQTLQEMVVLSLEQRAALLSQHHETVVSAGQLREIYRMANIKRLKVNYASAYQMSHHAAQERRSLESRHLFERYQFALTHGLRILYLDEVKFQARVEFNSQRAWTAPGEQLKIVDHTTPTANVHVVAAIDVSGLVYYEVTKGKYDQHAYLACLQRLRTKLGDNRSVALFYDGLSLHKTRLVQDALMRDFGWLPLLNVAYQPNNNPIESFFSIVKRDYRMSVAHDYIERTTSGEQRAPIKKVGLVERIFDKYIERDNTALVAGAEKHIEKVVMKKFKREEKKRSDEKELREFLTKVYSETLKARLDFSEA